MTWYAAHIILAIELRDAPQDDYFAYENVVLIAARDGDEAMAKAEARGRADASQDDPTFRLDGCPARWVYVGVRKLVRCDPDDEPPGEGTEVTYNKVYLDSREALARFAAGDSIRVELADES